MYIHIYIYIPLLPAKERPISPSLFRTPWDLDFGLWGFESGFACHVEASDRPGTEGVWPRLPMQTVAVSFLRGS